MYNHPKNSHNPNTIDKLAHIAKEKLLIVGNTSKQLFENIRHSTVKKYIALSLVGALTIGGTVHYINKDKDASPNKTTLSVEGTDTLLPETTCSFPQQKLSFWDTNPDFFAKDITLKKETLAPGVHIIRDVGLTFYIVQKWDNLTSIRQKLSKLPEFAYLAETQYDRSNPNTKTKSFNVPASAIQAWMFIPIPLDNTDREISPQNFVNYCYEAIKEMQSPENPYHKHIKKLLGTMTEANLVAAMLAFARSETAEEYSTFVSPLWDTEIHRWEPRFKAFSFTYFHILMEKNLKDKTKWPWLEARLKLWLTEGQCYHPKNAVKLFLAYRIEKTNGNISQIFPLTKKNMTTVATIYNGSSTYAPKLSANYTYAYNLVHGKIVYYDDANLKKSGFIYKGLTKSYQHMYTFKTPKDIHTIEQLKQFIVTKFNQYKSSDCPAITTADVLTRSWTTLTWSIVPDIIMVKIPKK